MEDTSYILRVSFVELYNEQLFDLLSVKPRREDTMVDIREDGKGIKIPGLTEVEVGAIWNVQFELKMDAIFFFVMLI